MPKNEFDTITWIKKPEWNKFKEDINNIIFDMLND